MKCRHCENRELEKVIDLGTAPPSNNYLKKEELGGNECFYPLRLKVCPKCWLVQTEDYAKADELFRNDYAYFSSTSPSWVEHARKYVEKIVKKLSLDKESLVIEVASNDGYLLQHFKKCEIPVLGIEPTESTALAAMTKGIPTKRNFFGKEFAKQLAKEGVLADLLIGNNVYAHVPDINDFTEGLKIVLKLGGTLTLEFPHLQDLLKENQFDTIYHEHYSYLSLFTVQKIFAKAGLRLFDVEKLSTHGGSLRIYGCHDSDPREIHPRVQKILQEERVFGLQTLTPYKTFQNQADSIKEALYHFLVEQKRAKKRVAAYGAAAKGNTLLNYAGIKPDLLPYVCDAAPSKQGKFLPASRIPIYPPEFLYQDCPDYVLILPWNLQNEIMSQLQTIRQWKGQFVVAIPKLQILET